MQKGGGFKFIAFLFYKLALSCLCHVFSMIKNIQNTSTLYTVICNFLSINLLTYTLFHFVSRVFSKLLINNILT
ncbi:MAG: hypothetical protein JWR50_2672 [Mucilaginibacter sp.]|nr:hypothetical protein [Mucilaginibacter sp.]